MDNKQNHNKLDSYHRKLLRNALNIRWPNKISNEHLYELTKQKKWSHTIKVKKLKWFGHAVQLPVATPAHQALLKALETTKKNKAGQTTTWLKAIKKDHSKVNLSIQEAMNKARERDEWRKVVSCMDALCA